MRYILYIRKSTEDRNKQVQSLDDQIQFGEKLAQDRGHTIIDTIVESKSAKKPGRPGFAQLMDKIEKNEADGIICWKLDRLSRNPLDSGKIQWMLQSGNLKQIDTSDRNYYPEDHALLMNVEFGMSNQYIRDLGKNVSRGMQSKVNRGIKPGPAPLGYINDPAGRKGERVIFKDPEQFSKMKKVLKMAATGKYSINQVFLYAKDKLHLKTAVGGGVSRSRFYLMIKNPFYYGYFLYKGQLYKGSHPPMITKAEYDKIQEVVEQGTKGKGRQKDIQTAYIDERENYRGLFRCKQCGCQMIFDKKIKKQKNGNKHTYRYYRCSRMNPKIKCDYQYVREEKVEEQIKDMIQLFSISPTVIDWYIDMKKNSKDNSGYDTKERERKLKELITKKEQKIDRLIMTLADEDNENMRESYKKNIKLLQTELIDLQEQKKTIFSFAQEKAKQEIDLFMRVKDISTQFEKANITQRSEILRSLQSNLFLDHGKLISKPSNELKALQVFLVQYGSYMRTIELKIKQREARKSDFSQFRLIWCAEEDLNLQGLTPTRPSI